MITEILADLNNAERIILYTEDSQLYNAFRELPECISAAPYTSNGAFVGGDLYFNRNFSKSIRSQLKKLSIKVE